MPDVQAMLTLLEEHGAFVSPFVRTIIDMEASGEVVTKDDALMLLRMCARSHRRRSDIGSVQAPPASDALRAA